MRKYFSCNTTKNLKSIFIEDCDCHFDRPLSQIHLDINHSTCKQCFFDICSCDCESHLASECIEDSTCENHEQTKKYDTNWNDYNYDWELKKTKSDECFGVNN